MHGLVDAQALDIGQIDDLPRTPGMFSGCVIVVNFTNFALLVGETSAAILLNSIPIQGTTIDHASTQRNR